MKRFFTLITLLCYGPLIWATLNVEVSAHHIQPDEKLRLLITSNDPNASSVLPDLSVLGENFAILGTAHNLSYTSINGQANIINQWTVMLLPKKTGMVKIPAIKVGAEYTAPLLIQVYAKARALGASKTFNTVQSSKASYMEVSVSTTQPFINQQVIYKVKFYNRQQFLDAAFNPPHAKNAVLMPLGQSQRHQEEINGLDYTVDEQEYAIFPQDEGVVTIATPLIQGLIVSNIPEQVSIRGKSIKLHVKPIPVTMTHSWLPAKLVELTESYDQSDTTLKQGSAIIRTIRLKAVGLPAELLPRLTFSGDQTFSLYPEKPVLQNSIEQDNVVGTLTIRMTYIMHHTGAIQIPAMSVYWFNTTTGAMEQLKLPEKNYLIQVNTGASNSGASNSGASNSGASNSGASNSGASNSGASNSGASNSGASNSGASNSGASNSGASRVIVPSYKIMSIWPILTLIFAGAWIFTLLLWWLQRYRSSKTRINKKLLLAELRQACQRQDAYTAKNILLQWLVMEWKCTDTLSLEGALRRIQDPRLHQACERLVRYLYSPRTNTSEWDGMELWHSVNRFRKKRKKQRPSSRGLPDIHEW